VELLNRYLIAVGANLPKSQRDDILKELAENIRAQIEDREAGLGRALTEAEQEAILRQHGNPLIVAGRYWHDDGSLTLGRRIIGPPLFPFYVKVLWFNLGVSSFLTVLIILALSQGGLPITFSGAMESLFWTLLGNTVVITLIFAAIDKHCAKFPERWDLGKPRDAGLSGLLDHAEADGSPRVSRVESVSQFIAGAVFLVWLRVVVHSAYWMFGPAVGAFRIEPIWHRIYVPFVLLILASMIQPAVNFFRPDWTRFRSIVRTALGIAGLATWFLVLKAGQILAVRSAIPTPSEARIAHTVNTWFFTSVFITATVSVVLVLLSVRRLIRDLRHTATAVRAGQS
jgi:hypothetical protein